jgi:hypothetical protein
MACQVEKGAIATDNNPNEIKLFGKLPGRLFIHPTSVMFSESKYVMQRRCSRCCDIPRFSSPHAVFFEKACTNKIFLRDITVMPPYPILLFGGEVSVDHENSAIFVDGW